MSEEERERIAGRVVLDLARKKKDLACLKSKAQSDGIGHRFCCGLLGDGWQR